MIPLLQVDKRLSRKGAAELTPARLVAALDEHDIASSAGTARFAGAIAPATATKSLPAIARAYPALQPKFRMTPALALGHSIADEEKLDFAAAMTCRNRDMIVMSETSVAFEPGSPSLEGTLAMVAEILARHPHKAYKYALELAFSGADFGPEALHTLPAAYVDGRDRYEATLSPMVRMALFEQRDSAVMLVLSANGVALRARCLLRDEIADTGALGRARMPPAFASLLASLAPFKASEVRRQAVVSVAELEHHNAAAQAQVAQRAAVTGADVQALDAGNYAALSIEQRLLIEFALHEHVLGTPFTEVTVDANANAVRKEWLLVKISSALLPSKLGVEWSHMRLTHLRQRAAAALAKGEFTTFAALLEANPAADRISAYRAGVEARLQQAVKDASAHMRGLAASGSLPHRLDDAPTRAAAAAEKFDRRKVLDRVFRPLGYERVPQPVGSVGLFEYAKQLADGEAIRLLFDFGTWRKTVDGTFSFSAGQIIGLTGSRFNVRYVYWARDGDIPIASEDLFVRTFENIGALTTMLEREHVPKFRTLLDEVRLT